MEQYKNHHYNMIFMKLRDRNRILLVFCFSDPVPFKYTGIENQLSMFCTPKNLASCFCKEDRLIKKTLISLRFFSGWIELCSLP